MSTPSIAERVAAGAQWLDENVPDWVERIDLERLNLASCADCMLGQLFGYFDDAPLEARTAHSAPSLGFDREPRIVLSVTSVRQYADLTAEWVRVIQERRQAAGASS